MFIVKWRAGWSNKSNLATKGSASKNISFEKTENFTVYVNGYSLGCDLGLYIERSFFFYLSINYQWKLWEIMTVSKNINLNMFLKEWWFNKRVNQSRATCHICLKYLYQSEVTMGMSVLNHLLPDYYPKLNLLFEACKIWRGEATIWFRSSSSCMGGLWWFRSFAITRWSS